MEKMGLIKSYVAFLDAGKLGLMVWNVYLQIQDATKKEEDVLINYLSGLKAVWWVARCSGNWDMIFSLCVKDVKQFYNIVLDIHNKFGKYIQKQSIEAHADVEVISRGHFLDAAGEGKAWFRDIFLIQLADEDKKILRVLSVNARMSSVEIAKKTGLTARIVAYRIKKLMESGIIHSFRLQLDVSKIGLSFYKVIIFLKEFTYEKNTALKEYCVREGNIFHYEQKIGPWMLELELDSENYESADRQLKKMKEKYSDFIKSYELLLITEEAKGDLDLTKML